MNQIVFQSAVRSLRTISLIMVALSCIFPLSSVLTFGILKETCDSSYIYNIPFINHIPSLASRQKQIIKEGVPNIV